MSDEKPKSLEDSLVDLLDGEIDELFFKLKDRMLCLTCVDGFRLVGILAPKDYPYDRVIQNNLKAIVEAPRETCIEFLTDWGWLKSRV